MAKKKDEMTTAKNAADFKRAYQAKSRLIRREKEDHLFYLGEQWSAEDKAKLAEVHIKPYVDNRIAPNIHLLTGLERQNRSEFKAFPEGEEDGVRAEIASALFKDCIKRSGFLHKSSEQFKDGIACGESHLELYLDYTDSFINGKPCFTKVDGDSLFPDPASREYDFSDARYVYKVKLDVSQGDLISLYPEKEKLIRSSNGGKLDMILTESPEKHRQSKGYGLKGGDNSSEDRDDQSYDLLERYYKKWVSKVFIGDMQTGEIVAAEDADKADGFIAEYQAGIARDQDLYAQAMSQHQEALAMRAQGMANGAMMAPGMPVEAPPEPVEPPAPPEQDPARFKVIKRQVPEIWVYAQVPGIEDPLADEVAWSYPKWKNYPFAPYFARYSTAPLTGDDRHLLIQGLVHGVKGSQEIHNKAEMLMLRHLNTSTNSGWLTRVGAWVDAKKAELFGTAPGINLEWQGDHKPERMEPAPLSQGHAKLSAEKAEAIKASLGINSDLLATQAGGTDSGRAIAMRQKQGILMVQELFDNHSRTRQIAGKMILSQLGEMYDTETAMKVMGEAWLVKTFPPVMLHNPNDPAAEPEAMPDEFGRPMKYDKKLAELAIAEVLKGDLEKYDVSVGEAVASETQRMAVAAEIREMATAFPGIVTPEVVVSNSQLPESAKKEILAAVKRAQVAAARPVPGAPPAASGMEA